MKELKTGNGAMCEGAIAAKCDAYFGYPITPQNEVTEVMAKRMVEEGRVFLQPESELAAISMVMGGAATGKRVMTSSSSPGLSLMQEGLSYLCGCELPCVVANVVRGGPGLGSIGPAQSDYFQAVYGGGHGDYNMLVLAPNSIQECYDFTYYAFDLAFKYRNPVMILIDGLIGQMMEPLNKCVPAGLFDFPAAFNVKSWALDGAQGRESREIKSLFLVNEKLEIHNYDLQAKYNQISQDECRFDTYLTDDAEYLFVAYGISARICREAVNALRKKGIKTGLLRPITLWPYPEKWLHLNAPQFKYVLAVELSCGQMVKDVKLAVEGQAPVSHFGKAGGVFLQVDEVIEHALGIFK